MKQDLDHVGKRYENTGIESRIAERFKKKQLEALYGQLPFSLLVTTVISILFFLALYDFSDQGALRI